VHISDFAGQLLVVADVAVEAAALEPEPGTCFRCEACEDRRIRCAPAGDDAPAYGELEPFESRDEALSSGRADDQVNVLGHHHECKEGELVFCAARLQALDEQVGYRAVLEERKLVLARKREEPCSVGVVVSLETLAPLHRLSLL